MDPEASASTEKDAHPSDEPRPFPFMRLPCELRRAIWTLALHPQQPRLYYFTVCKVKPFEQPPEPVPVLHQLRYSTRPIRTMLAICRESRIFVQHAFPDTFQFRGGVMRFNGKRDLLYAKVFNRNQTPEDKPYRQGLLITNWGTVRGNNARLILKHPEFSVPEDVELEFPVSESGFHLMLERCQPEKETSQDVPGCTWRVYRDNGIWRMPFPTWQIRRPS